MQTLPAIAPMGTIFHGSPNFATFNGSTIGHDAQFTDVLFEGPVDMADCHVGGSLVIDQCRFENKDVVTSFNTTQVGNTLFVRGSRFAGVVDFSFLQAQFNVEMSDTKFFSGVTFDSTRVGHYGFFGSTTFNGDTSFSKAAFGTLELDASRWNTVVSSVTLDGLEFKQLSAAPQADSGALLIELLDRAAFCRAAYLHAENFFKAEGQPNAADEVFQRLKKRERQEILWPTSKAKWAWSWLLKLTVNYGRSPVRALGISLFVVAIGAIVFGGKGMELKKDCTKGYAYSRFWYSLDLFAPVINLEAANRWEPKPERRLAWVYLRLHRLLGWTLVPLGIAAVSGLLNAGAG
jgi:hypothetical protein